MILYGTTTSPFVRRVRVVAAELGLAYTLINTATDEGQAQMRGKNPLWKVPTAEVDGLTLFDSRAINDYLLAKHGPKNLHLPDEKKRWHELNILNAIDGVQDSAINYYYLRREVVDVTEVPYLVKQLERVGSALRWIESHLQGAYFSADQRLGVAEIALIAAFDWLGFRDVYDCHAHPKLTAMREIHGERVSIKNTLPHA